MLPFSFISVLGINGPVLHVRKRQDTSDRTIVMKDVIRNIGKNELFLRHCVNLCMLILSDIMII